MSASVTATPLKDFVEEDKWEQHRFKIADFDGGDITGVFFGSGLKVGDFRLQIDEVQLRSF